MSREGDGFAALSGDALELMNVIFFITTARSGTQFLGNTLGSVFPDVLRAEHEPVEYLYRPCTTLRNVTALEEQCRDPRIQAHFQSIHRTLDSGKSYVEVGFPAFAMAPILQREFGARLRIVQLTRNPIEVAASLVTHGWYVRNRRRDLQGTVALTPMSSGVALKDYALRWKRMNAFEKALFYWYEVHDFGLEVEKTSDPGTYARFQFEQLVEKTACFSQLVDFMGLPERQLPEHAKIDKHVHRTAERINPRAAERHPRIMELSRELGYAPEECDFSAIANRYQRHPFLVHGKTALNGIHALLH